MCCILISLRKWAWCMHYKNSEKTTINPWNAPTFSGCPTMPSQTPTETSLSYPIDPAPPSECLCCYCWAFPVLDCDPAVYKMINWLGDVIRLIMRAWFNLFLNKLSLWRVIRYKEDTTDDNNNSETGLVEPIWSRLTFIIMFLFVDHGSVTPIAKSIFYCSGIDTIYWIYCKSISDSNIKININRIVRFGKVISLVILEKSTVVKFPGSCFSEWNR